MLISPTKKLVIKLFKRSHWGRFNFNLVINFPYTKPRMRGLIQSSVYPPALLKNILIWKCNFYRVKKKTQRLIEIKVKFVPVYQGNDVACRSSLLFVQLQWVFQPNKAVIVRYLAAEDSSALRFRKRVSGLQLTGCPINCDSNDWCWVSQSAANISYLTKTYYK